MFALGGLTFSTDKIGIALLIPALGAVVLQPILFSRVYSFKVIWPVSRVARQPSPCYDKRVCQKIVIATNDVIFLIFLSFMFCFHVFRFSLKDGLEEYGYVIFWHVFYICSVLLN